MQLTHSTIGSHCTLYNFYIANQAQLSHFYTSLFVWLAGDEMDAVGDGEGDLLSYLQRSAREGWVRLSGEQSGHNVCMRFTLYVPLAACTGIVNAVPVDERRGYTH